MGKLPLRKQLVFVAIVTGVAALVAFLFALLAAAAQRPPDVQPWLIGMVFGSVAGAIYLGVAGNRAAPLADAAALAQAIGPVPSGTARLLVVREGFVGKLAGVDVAIDGVERAQLRSPRFAAFDLPPGPHVVRASLRDRVASLSVELIAEETAVARIVVSGGAPRIAVEPDLAGLRQRLPSIPMVAS